MKLTTTHTLNLDKDFNDMTSAELATLRSLSKKYPNGILENQFRLHYTLNNRGRLRDNRHVLASIEKRTQTVGISTGFLWFEKNKNHIIDLARYYQLKGITTKAFSLKHPSKPNHPCYLFLSGVFLFEIAKLGLVSQDFIKPHLQDISDLNSYLQGNTNTNARITTVKLNEASLPKAVVSIPTKASIEKIANSQISDLTHQHTFLESENQYLWSKIAELEQKQLKYLIELTEPKPSMPEIMSAECEYLSLHELLTQLSPETSKSVIDNIAKDYSGYSAV